MSKKTKRKPTKKKSALDRVRVAVRAGMAKRGHLVPGTGTADAFIEDLAAAAREPDTLLAETETQRTARIEREARAQVDHPAHYGGAENPREAIKVIEEYDLGFRLGNAVKYILRADRTTDRGDDSRLVDLEKARWYLDREIERSKNGQAES